MSKYTTPAARIAELVAKYGSYEKASEAIGMTKSYLWEIGSGTRDIGTLSVDTIRRLGLQCGPAFKKA